MHEYAVVGRKMTISYAGNNEINHSRVVRFLAVVTLRTARHRELHKADLAISNAASIVHSLMHFYIVVTSASCSYDLFVDEPLHADPSNAAIIGPTYASQ